MKAKQPHALYVVDDATLKAILVASLRMHGVTAELDGIELLLVHARRNLDAHLLLDGFQLPEGLDPAEVFQP